jgi:hypothetical protein
MVKVKKKPARKPPTWAVWAMFSVIPEATYAVSVSIVMKTKRIAGRGRGIKPNNLRTHRKGNKMANAARIPKIAPEAPIVGIVLELFK